LTIASIYKPIEPEMIRLEENLDRIAEAAASLGITEQLNHILKDGGKRIRPALTLLAGKFYHYNVESLLPMAVAVELLHTATLVHDDTLDYSQRRRGKPTINSLWGSSITILLGDYLFATSACITSETGNVRIGKLFAQTLMDICSGEIDESLSPFNLKQGRQRYFQRIGNKTACLFSMATESGAVLSKAPEEVVQSLKSYGYNLGIGFQIIDDILDFIGQEEIVGKPVASDLSRGIFTLPAILFLERPESNAVKEVFNQDKQEGARLMREMIHKSSIAGECYRIAQDFCSQACLALEPLPRNTAYNSLIDLAEYVIKRKS